MTEGRKEKRYDTNPLDERVAERAEAEMGAGEPVDTESPTRPMAGPPPEAHHDAWRDAARGHARDTAPDGRATGPAYPSPSAPVGAPTHGRYAPPSAYMPPRSQPPGWEQPPPGAIGQQLYGLHGAPPPSPPRGAAELGLKPNFAAMLCYLPFIGIVGSILLTQYEPAEHRFVRFHAKQSLYAHIAFWAFTFAFSIGRASAPGFVGALLLLPQLAFYFASIAGFVYMMVRSYQGDAVRIPLIGDQVE